MAINLGSALVYLGAKMDGLKSDLDDAEQETTSWAKRLGNNLLGLVGGAVVGGVSVATAAISGIGAVAFSTAQDIDAATKKAMSQLGSQAADQAKLSETIANVYANNWGDSIEDVGAAVTAVTQNMDRFGDMTADELQRATEHAIALRDAFGLEVSETASAATTLMENFGISADEAFALVQSGLQNGLNRSGDFLDTIGEYSTQFANGGASVSEFFNIMDSGLQGGMLGTDKAADLFKEFRLRIQDGSESTADALAQIGLSVNEITEGLNDGSLDVMDVFTQVQSGIARAENRTTAFNAGVALMGSQFEDLGDSAVNSIDPLTNTMEDWIGMTSDINAQYGTLGNFLEGMKRKAQVGLAPLGNIMLDLANRALPTINQGFEWFQGKLEGAVGVIETFADYLSFAADEGDWLNDSLSNLPTALQPVAKFIGEIVGRISEGESPIEAIKNTISGMVSPETADRIEALTTSLGDFITKVKEFVTEHAETLKGALIAIGGVLLTMSIADTIGDIAGSLTSLASPIGILAAVTGIFMAAWENNWFGIRDVLKETWEVVEPILLDLSGWFRRDGQRIIPVIAGIASAFAAFSVISTVIGWISGLGAALSAAGAAITAAGGGLAGIVAILGGPVTLAIAAVAGLIGLLAAAWNGNWGGMRDTLTAVWNDTIKPALEELGVWIQTVVIPALNDLYTQWVTVVWPAIQTAISTAWNEYIKPIIEAVDNYINTILLPTIEKLRAKWVDEVWPAIQSIIKSVSLIIDEIFTEINRWINDNLIPILEALRKKWVEEVWPPIQEKLEEVWAVIQPILEEVRTWLEEKLTVALKAIHDEWGRVMDFLSEKVNTIGQPINEFFDRIIEFADWLAKQVFDFEFNLPDLPEWAVPHSPLPIHTAWAAFGREMNNMKIAPKVDLGTAGAALMGGMGGNSSSVSIGDVYVQPPAGATRPGDYGTEVQGGLRRAMRSKGVIK